MNPLDFLSENVVPTELRDERIVDVQLVTEEIVPQQKLLDRAYEIMMAEATSAIHDGDAKCARAKLREAFRFRPFRTMASGRLAWLLIAPW